MTARDGWIVAVAFCASCGPPSAGPTVQRLVDGYAPSLTIGSRLSADALQRYHFEVSAYVGYVDEHWEGPDGVRKLIVDVDRDLDKHGEKEISPYANVRSVSFDAPTPAVAARVDARIRAALGAPTVACYIDGYRRRDEVRVWPVAHGRGVQMLVFRDIVAHGLRPDPYVQGSAMVGFFVQPISPKHVHFEPCP